MGHFIFLKGHCNLNEELDFGIGKLINKSQSSSCFKNSVLRIVIKNLIWIGLHISSIEDKLTYIFKTLDCLCNYFRTYRGGTISSAKYFCQVDKIIKQASTDILNVSNDAKNEGNDNDAELLFIIANKCKNIIDRKLGFGKSVRKLLEKFNLTDAKIIDKYFSENPSNNDSELKNFERVIDYCRNKIIHRGFLQFRDGKNDIKTIYCLLTHLYDIILRIVFKMLEYEGRYQPTVILSPASFSLDWIKKDTLPSKLGYK